MLDLVIFDADGVLFDSTLSNTAYYNAIFAAMGEPPMNPEEEKAGVYLAAPQVFEMRAGADLVRLQRMREIARTLDATPFFKMMIPALELRPFMTELKRDYRLGLATNRSATIPSLINFLGLDGIFDAVASVRDKVKPKPAPDILKLCIERAGTHPQRAVYVGDSATDRIAAEGAGTHYIGLGDRSGRERGDAHRIDTLAELPERLQRLFKPRG
ncbi:MAG TPA: HAD family hydrolase [Candidatus Binataceae bacterium]|nr:HAD family hydrolase [Candidatus Binataceae bacterium]